MSWNVSQRYIGANELCDDAVSVLGFSSSAARSAWPARPAYRCVAVVTARVSVSWNVSQRYIGANELCDDAVSVLGFSSSAARSAWPARPAYRCVAVVTARVSVSWNVSQLTFFCAFSHTEFNRPECVRAI